MELTDDMLEALGFCGCGNPKDVAGYVFFMMKRHVAIDQRFHVWNNHKGRDDMAVLFFLYWATEKGFIEHGTSVWCSWITDKGSDIMKKIKEALDG